MVVSRLIATLLEEAGYQSVTIAEHDQIGDAIARFDPKCVILDGEVGRTGQSRSWDDAATVRRDHPALPVLKPFIVEEFLSTLHSAVSGSLSADADAVAIFPDPSGQLAAEWARTDFFSTAVHELKTPLTVISGQLQRARRLMNTDLERGRAAMDIAHQQGRFSNARFAGERSEPRVQWVVEQVTRSTLRSRLAATRRSFASFVRVL